MNREEFNEWIDKQDIYFSYKPIKLTGVNVKDGWLQIVKNLIEELLETGWDRKVHTIKEKFGSLRFYLDNPTKEQNKIIVKYLELSSEICVHCGKKATIREGNWIEPLCDEHANGRNTFNFPNLDKLLDE